MQSTFYHHSNKPFDHKPPTETLDNSLTSLNWLPDFQIDSVTEQPCLSSADKSAFKNGTSIQDSDKESTEREEISIPLSPLKRCMTQTAEFEQNPWRYEHDPNKPPFSYTTIIYLAIRSSKNDKVMLSEIYQWIKDHFMYYRLAEPTWQNSVRHNLSLNEFFRKIPRGEGDPGKGSFWQINPDYEHIVTNEDEFQRLEDLQNNYRIFNGHRNKGKGRKKLYSTSNSASSSTQSRQKKRSKSTSNVPSTVDPCHLPGDLDWVSLLSSQRLNCGLCTGTHNCRPSFGSPVLGPPDLGHIGDPVLCSPAMIPTTLPSRVPETPPIILNTTNHSILDDVVMSTEESPALLLPPWVESRSQSPNLSLEHPWAETKERIHSSTNHLWSPDPSWGVGLTNGSHATTSSGTVPVAQLI